MHQGKPVIGLLCDHTSAVLEGLINRAGYRAVRRQSEQVHPGNLPEVDAWVVDCDDSDQIADTLAWLEPAVLATSNRPSHSQPIAYRRWCEKIIVTLEKWTGHLRHDAGQKSTSSASAYRDVQGVWVLAGSTGAGIAVREFLGSLTRVPPVAFVYAQHVDQRQESTLTSIGHGNREMGCYLALGRHWLNPGHILAVPATSRLRFGRYGEVFSTREPWSTPETPNIDELMLSMCGMQPAPAGAIIFSGAGTDGCRGLAALSEVGTRIWAQDPSTCEAPSMPGAAIEAGLVTLAASPAVLARHLLAGYPEEDTGQTPPE
jgi:chemotaxis response regulator CheB